jgi:hypothetical protein
MPVKAAGNRIDPPVSLPMAKGTALAATAAAGPLDDPSVHRPVSQGLAGGPVSEASGLA